MLERQLTPKYGYMGTNKEGESFALSMVVTLADTACRVLQAVADFRSRYPTRAWIRNVRRCVVLIVRSMMWIIFIYFFLAAIILKIKTLSH